MKPLYIFAPLLFSGAAVASPPEIDFFTVWQSKYVSEGRDNLAGNGLLTSGIALAQGNFDTEILYGVEDSRSDYSIDRYREWNAIVGYSNSIGPLNWRGSYKHLWFPSSDEQDSEWTLDLSTTTDSNITTSFAYTYATEAGGGFYELAVEYPVLCGSHCQLFPYAMISDNQGFVADGETGLNNAQLGVALLVLANKQVSFIAEANYSYAFDEDTEQGLEELVWLNLGLNYHF